MSLLQLPREVRDRIYEYAYGYVLEFETISKLGAYDIGQRSFSPNIMGLQGQNKDQSVALIAVNRQISAEVGHLLYYKTTFEGPAFRICSFLESLGRWRHRVQRLIISDVFNAGSSHFLPQIFKLLPTLTGLNSVQLHTRDEDIDSTQQVLIEDGICKLTGCMDVAVIKRRLINHREHFNDVPSEVCTEYWTIWSCAKNKMIWKKGGQIHCAVTRRRDKETQRWRNVSHVMYRLCQNHSHRPPL